ncbi:MAG: Activator of Hsp90 ATPase 1 family protein [Frankiales bacterium]|nr:Activator of Hsp90 ATPase 1 family protein [Frankiales bacterium]
MTTALDTDFRAVRTLSAAPDVVFDAVTSADTITRWWGPATGTDELTLRFAPGRLVLRVDRAERPTALVWSVLLAEPSPEWIGTHPVFSLSPTADGGTELTFTHEGLTPRLECFDSCQGGWNHYLTSLVDFLDRGTGSPYLG